MIKREEKQQEVREREENWDKYFESERKIIKLLIEEV